MSRPKRRKKFKDSRFDRFAESPKNYLIGCGSTIAIVLIAAITIGLSINATGRPGVQETSARPAVQVNRNGDCTEVMNAFVRVYLSGRNAASTDGWVSNLSPLADAEVIDGLRFIDRSTIPSVSDTRYDLNRQEALCEGTYSFNGWDQRLDVVARNMNNSGWVVHSFEVVK